MAHYPKTQMAVGMTENSTLPAWPLLC
jgi:hypothetical protein